MLLLFASCRSENVFTVNQIDEQTFVISEKGSFESVNCFLIIGSEKALLFDTGLGLGNIRLEVERLTSKPIIVINSHAHYDHVNGNHLFESVLLNNNPFSIKESEGLDSQSFREFYKKAYKNPNPDLPKGYEKTAFDYNKLIKETVIELGNRPVRIIQTPGHTPDGLCLLDMNNNLLFTGDTFYQGTLFLHLDESDYDTYKTSIAQLSGILEYDKLAPAHGPYLLNRSKLDSLKKAMDKIELIRNKENTASKELRMDGFKIFIK